MESKSIGKNIGLFLYIILAITLLYLGWVSHSTSSLTNIFRNRKNATINFLIKTNPAMFISYSAETKKGLITNLTKEESALPTEEIIKSVQGESAPLFILTPITEDREVFWESLKYNLSTWRRNPHKVIEYIYDYIYMRIKHKTDINVGDFILLSYELPSLSGVDFTIKSAKEVVKQEKSKKKKSKNKKKEKVVPVLNVVKQGVKKQHEDTILTIEVFNASDKNGLAAEVTRYLRDLNSKKIFKVDVIKFTSAKEKRDITKIVDFTGRVESLKKLSKYLGITDKEIYFTEDKNAISDARIYLGQDFNLPKKLNK